MSNPYQVELDALKQKVAELENKIAEDNKPKVVPWEPKKEGHYLIRSDLSVVRTNCEKQYYDYEILGSFCRTTENKANSAAKAIASYAKLLAYKDEFASEYEPDWEEANTGKYFITYDEFRSTWRWSSSTYLRNPMTIYFPQDIAVALVKKLTSGEVVL